MIFAEKVATPTKMAPGRHQNGIKIENGCHHRVPHEKIDIKKKESVPPLLV